MGGDIKNLRARIKSVDSTLHLTSAMGLVASSKIRRAGTAMQNVSACAAGIASHTPVSLSSCGRMSSTTNVSTGSENTSTYDSAVFSVA